MPTLPSGPTLPLSYSSISNYLGCPEKYKHQYVERLKNIVIDVDDISFGSACHVGFADYDRHLKKIGRKRSLRYLKSRMAHWFASVPGIDGSRYDEFRGVMLQFARYHPFNPQEMHDAEQLLTITKEGKPCAPGSPESFMIGHLDRLDIIPERKLARIVDYKTNRSGQANTLQLLIYAVLVAFHYPEIKWFELIFEFPRLGGIRSPYSRHYVPVSKSRDVVLRTWDLVLAVFDKISQDPEFVPRVSTACQTCPYIPICSARPYVPVQVDTEPSAKEIGRSILILENRQKVYREALSRYVDRHGPVQVNDRQFSIEGVQHFSGDVNHLLALCKAHKISPQKVLTVDSTQLKSLMKRERDIAEILSSAVVVSVQSRMTHKKIDSEHDTSADEIPSGVDGVKENQTL